MEEDTEPPSSMPEPSEPPASTDLNLDLVPLKQEKPFSCSRPAEDGDNAGAAAAVVGPSSSSAAAASSSLSSPPAPPSPSSAELDHIFQHDRKLDARARKTALQGGISHELSLELHLLAQAGDVPAMDRLSAIRVAHADRERSKQRQGPPPWQPKRLPRAPFPVSAELAAAFERNRHHYPHPRVWTTAGEADLTAHEEPPPEGDSDMEFFP